MRNAFMDVSVKNASNAVVVRIASTDGRNTSTGVFERNACKVVSSRIVSIDVSVKNACYAAVVRIAATDVSVRYTFTFAFEKNASKGVSV
jgi:hypothetical protein